MFGTIKQRIIVIAGLAAVSMALVATTAMAQGNPNNGDEECKPGWGWGDKHHCHDGPPGGPSVHPVK